MARRREPLTFTALRLGNWRNFVQAELALTPRTIIVGPNASGKSNLLDALRFLHDLATPTGGLAAALAQPWRGGFSKLRSLNAKGARNDVLIGVEVGPPGRATRWTYDLAINQKKRPLEEPGVVSERIGDESGRVIGEQIRPDGADPAEFARTLVEDGRANKTFRELAQFFASVRYSHVVPHIVRDRRRWISDDDPFGSDILRQINATPEGQRQLRLKAIVDLLKLAVPNLISISLELDDAGRPHLEARMQFWRKPAARQTEEHFSDGTLRLLGFLWAIMEPGGPLLLEEPELSLHEEVVAQLPAFIAAAQARSGRQVILTTHSRAILAAPGLRPAEVHWLTPGANGTSIHTASKDLAVMAELRGGSTLAEAVLPRSAPRGVDQFAHGNVPAS